MEIKVLEKEKNKLRFEIKGESHTLCNYLKDELWNDKDVSVVGYQVEHPLTASPVFTIETKTKDPKKAVLEAIKRIEDRNKELLALFKKL